MRVNFNRYVFDLLYKICKSNKLFLCTFKQFTKLHHIKIQHEEIRMSVSK